MNDTPETVYLELKRLQERNLYVEERNLRYVSILDMLASSSEFQEDLNRDRDIDSIFNATLQQVKRLLAFTYMGFYMNSDESSFELLKCDPPSCRQEL